MGKRLVEAGNYEEARRILSPLLDLPATETGLSADELAEALGHAGNCALAEGKFDEAEGLYRRALSAKDAPRSAGGVLYGMGLIALSRGEVEQVRQYFSQAIDAQQRAWGDKPERIGALMVAVAKTLRLRGDTEAALTYLRAARVTFAAAGEHGADRLPYVLAQEACTLYRHEQFAEAFRACHTVITLLHAKAAAPQAMAGAMWLLGLIEIGRGNCPQAGDALERAKEWVGKCEKPVPATLAGILCATGGLRLLEHREAEAQQCFEEALALCEQEGLDEELMAEVICNLTATWARRREKLDQAERYLTYAGDLLAGKPAEADRLRSLAAVLEAKGQFAQAEATVREALPLDAARPGRLPVVEDLAMLGRLYGQLGRPDDSRQAFERAIELASSVVPASHPILVDLRVAMQPPPPPAPVEQPAPPQA